MRLGFTVTLLALIFIFDVQRLAFAQNKLLTELVQQGIEVPGMEKPIRLPEPIFRLGMSRDEERSSIETLDGNQEIDRLLKKSFVSPFILKIENLAELPERGKIQQVSLWFVAYGRLEDIERKSLFDELAIPAKKKSGLAEEVRALTDKEIRERNLVVGDQGDGSKVSYGVLKTNVLDKVYLTGTTFSQSIRTAEAMSIAFRFDPKLKEDPQFPTRWHPLREDASGDAIIGNAFPYSIACAYAQAVPMKLADEALMIEIRILFAEPFDWFEGRNLLRSKLPPLLQETVRTFRRKLSAQ